MTDEEMEESVKESCKIFKCRPDELVKVTKRFLRELEEIKEELARKK